MSRRYRSGGSKRFGGSGDKGMEQTLQIRGINTYNLFGVSHDDTSSVARGR